MSCMSYHSCVGGIVNYTLYELLLKKYHIFKKKCFIKIYETFFVKVHVNTILGVTHNTVIYLMHLPYHIGKYLKTLSTNFI